MLSGVPAKKHKSSIEAQDNSIKDGQHKKKITSNQRLEAFWTMQDSHHMLAVFASGNAFVTAALDSLLAQSFYTAFMPLCRKGSFVAVSTRAFTKWTCRYLSSVASLLTFSAPS